MYFYFYSVITSSSTSIHWTSSVAMSLVATYVSGITLLGTSTEIYVYGFQYAYILAGPTVMGIFLHLVMIPVFHDLHVVSMYEVQKNDNLKSFTFLLILIFLDSIYRSDLIRSYDYLDHLLVLCRQFFIFRYVFICQPSLLMLSWVVQFSL